MWRRVAMRKRLCDSLLTRGCVSSTGIPATSSRRIFHINNEYTINRGLNSCYNRVGRIVRASDEYAGRANAAQMRAGRGLTRMNHFAKLM
ncbi:hypothetical protein EVAR_64107_1 [Eumeta japonica]|uniref:Uncharacterized protein n=1 Tax=Eumeta variegata TaxID=151549 RepID=A0A4C1ZGQ5_EUMVA|nr:hypothetical protein EVAR_64107_1 [Eumeta japonica]